MSCACNSQERIKIKLEEVIKISSETYAFNFSSDRPIEWQEGDSSKVFLEVAGKENGKKFSYATLPHENIIQFTTRIRADRSDFKEAMSSLKCGDAIEISEPSGQFGLRRNHRPVVLLSNGVGIAAIRTLIKAYEMDQTGVPHLLQINVDSKSAIYEKEFYDLSTQLPSFKSIYTQSRNRFFERLDFYVQDLYSMDNDDPLFYVVGSDAFVSDTIWHLSDMGISSESIITDGHKSGGTCGCSSDAGCGCGANLISDFSVMG